MKLDAVGFPLHEGVIVPLGFAPPNTSIDQVVTITGHTDSLPFNRSSGYSNWELSADRANATRRVLVGTGVNPSRLERISGLADTEPLTPEAPDAPQNRRIDILLAYPDPALKLPAPSGP